MLPGLLSNEDKHGLPVVLWGKDEYEASGSDPRDAMSALLSSLTPLDPGAIILSEDTYSQTAWRNDLEESETNIARARELGEDDEEINRLVEARKYLQKLKPHVGKISALGIWIITRNPSVVIEWMPIAPWKPSSSDRKIIHSNPSSRYLDDEDEEFWDKSELAEINADHKAKLKDRRKWEHGPRRDAVARQLAELPDFPACKREADRVYLLRRMLGDDAPLEDYIAKEITRQAGAIFRLEIAPGKP